MYVSTIGVVQELSEELTTQSQRAKYEHKAVKTPLEYLKQYIANARTLATQRGKHTKLNMSHEFELINCEMSMYVSTIGGTYDTLSTCKV